MISNTVNFTRTGGLYESAVNTSGQTTFVTNKHRRLYTLNQDTTVVSDI